MSGGMSGDWEYGQGPKVYWLEAGSHCECRLNQDLRPINLNELTSEMFPAQYGRTIVVDSGRVSRGAGNGLGPNRRDPSL